MTLSDEIKKVQESDSPKAIKDYAVMLLKQEKVDTAKDALDMADGEFGQIESYTIIDELKALGQ